MTLGPEPATVKVEIPEEVLEESDGHVTVVAEPTSEKTAERFQEWAQCSCGFDDVWMLVNAETGEIEEEYHAGEY